MLETYSLNVAVTANSAIPFNSDSITKGCTAVHSAPSTIDLNKSGVYMVSFDGTASASTTVQLYKDGIAQPQAQSTGTTPNFVTLVQVDRNNCQCNCSSSPVILRLVNTAAVTFTNANLVVTKVC